MSTTSCAGGALIVATTGVGAGACKCNAITNGVLLLYRAAVVPVLFQTGAGCCSYGRSCCKYGGCCCTHVLLQFGLGAAGMADVATATLRVYVIRLCCCSYGGCLGSYVLLHFGIAAAVPPGVAAVVAGVVELMANAAQFTAAVTCCCNAGMLVQLWRMLLQLRRMLLHVRRTCCSYGGCRCSHVLMQFGVVVAVMADVAISSRVASDCLVPISAATLATAGPSRPLFFDAIHSCAVPF